MEHNTTWSSKNMRILKQKLAIGLKITIVFFSLTFFRYNYKQDTMIYILVFYYKLPLLV